MSPLPKAKKRCPACTKEVFVRSGPDNRRYLMRQDELERMEHQWSVSRVALYERQRVTLSAAEESWWSQVAASGVFAKHTDGLDVVGESFYLAALVALAQRYPDGTAVGCLQREPGNPHDHNAIRVLIDGVQVGHLSRGDAEDYQPVLRAYERAKRTLFVVATLQGGALGPDGRHGPVGVYLERVPEVS